MRTSSLLVLCVLTCATVSAQVKAPGEFFESSTGLTMHYPVEMVVRDAQAAIEKGHIAAFSSMQNEAKEHKLAARCMKPLLLAELPADPTKPEDNTSIATLFLFDFSLEKDCTEGFKFKSNDAVAGGVAQTAIQLPGGIALTKPLYFDFGKEKMHASLAAFGVQKLAPGEAPALIGTAAMLYHGHILGWLLSARQLNTFNEVGKSNVLLDDGKTYPIIPFNLDDHLRPPSNLVK